MNRKKSSKKEKKKEQWNFINFLLLNSYQDNYKFFSSFYRNPIKTYPQVQYMGCHIYKAHTIILAQFFVGMQRKKIITQKLLKFNLKIAFAYLPKPSLQNL